MRKTTDKKSFILEKSFKLFLQKTYKEVTMRDIMRETMISKGAFYHYFPTKEDLFNEIIDTFYLKFFQIDYSIFSHDSLYDFYQDYLKFGKEEMTNIIAELELDVKNEALNYFLIMFDAMNIYPDFRHRALEVTGREMRAWKQMIALARERGEIKTSLRDDQIANIFVRGNDGISLHAIMRGDFNILLTEIEDFYNSFYNQIKA